MSGKTSAGTIVRRTLIVAAAAIAVTYLGDTVSVWVRMSRKTADDPLKSLTTQSIIEIPHKDGRDEIVLGDPQTQTCVRALFPHDGYSPCWYVARQNQSVTVMTLLPFVPAAGWATPHIPAAASLDSTRTRRIPQGDSGAGPFRAR
ncbi:MAG: hypothetical protein WBF06_07685 [Candidatus Acidiferrales bacterium]